MKKSTDGALYLTWGQIGYDAIKLVEQDHGKLTESQALDIMDDLIDYCATDGIQVPYDAKTLLRASLAWHGIRTTPYHRGRKGATPKLFKETT